MIEAGLARVAEIFWEQGGGLTAPPRDPTTVVARALPVSVIMLPGLSIRTIEDWLATRQAPYRFLCRNRALCGCLVAARGHGLLFVDADDPADARRFTIAHEIAHFMLDYDAPRCTALDLFGEPIRPVLDGERRPTAQERVDALLAGVPIGIFVNLMARDEQGGIDESTILRAEQRADRLALELLAPADEVLDRIQAAEHTVFERARQLTDTLVTSYGLPPPVARSYAAALLPDRGATSTASWLGL